MNKNISDSINSNDIKKLNRKDRIKAYFELVSHKTNGISSNSQSIVDINITYTQPKK